MLLLPGGYLLQCWKCVGNYEGNLLVLVSDVEGSVRRVFHEMMCVLTPFSSAYSIITF
jgi:hypothetical protein